MRVRRFFINQFPLSRPEFKSYDCKECVNLLGAQPSN